jgi:hypothetical protein
MTEEEWHGEFTFELYLQLNEWLRERRSNDRKLRLWACACCRRLGELLTDPRSRVAVDAAEQHADGLLMKTAVKAAARDAKKPPQVKLSFSFARRGEYTAEQWAASAAALTLYSDPSHFSQTAAIRAAIAMDRAGKMDRRAEDAAQVAVLRDIFGNPFRPVSFSPAWRTDTAIALARTMYEAREFSAMPILADALQDAGCDSEAVLTHCRDTSLAHVRGCWVIDLVLGKK